MQLDLLPFDLIRIIGLYLEIKDVVNIKCTNKYTNNSLNDKFFGFYWHIYCPNNFKIYYDKQADLIDTTNLNKCKKLDVINKTSKTLFEIIEDWDRCFENWDICCKNGTEFVCDNFWLIVMYVDKLNKHQMVVVRSAPDNQIHIDPMNYISTSLSDVLLDILHNKLVNANTSEKPVVRVNIENGDTDWEYELNYILYK